MRRAKLATTPMPVCKPSKPPRRLNAFDTTDVGIRQKDGTFKAPYGKKIYSLTHFVMNLKPMREYEVSAYLVLIEVIFVFLAFGLKFLHLL